MGVDITIHDVPEAVSDELARRADRTGRSLEDYVRGMLVDSAARPQVADVVARTRAGRIGVRVDAASILAARDADRR